MGFSHSVASCGQRDSLFVVHRHASESLANLGGSRERVRVSVHTLGVHINQTHLHGSERVLHGRRVVDALVALVTGGKPFLLRTPIGVFFRVPHIGTAKRKAERFQPH